MFVSETIDCAEDIADSLKNWTISPDQVKLISQERNVLLFYWYSTVENFTYIGCYDLRPDISTEKVRKLCGLNGKIDIVHMSMDENQLLLALVSISYIDKTKTYNIDIIDRLGSNDHTERRFPIHTHQPHLMVKAHFLRRVENNPQGNNPILFLFICVLGGEMYLHKLVCERLNAGCRVLKNRNQRIKNSPFIPSACGFIWSQWDWNQQRVYFLSVKNSPTTPVDKTGTTGVELSLEGREYRGLDNQNHVRCFLKVPLLIEYNGNNKSNNASVFGPGCKLAKFEQPQDEAVPDVTPLTDTLCWDFMNARVLAEDNGTFTLCLQLLQRNYDSGEGLTYYVVAFHHLITHIITAHDSSHSFTRDLPSKQDDLPAAEYSNVSEEKQTMGELTPRKKTQSFLEGTQKNSGVAKNLPIRAGTFCGKPQGSSRGDLTVNRDIEQRRRSDEFTERSGENSFGFSTDQQIHRSRSTTFVQYATHYNPNKILFLLYNHYVLAILPQSFIHMVDNGEHHGPSHDIYQTTNRIALFNQPMSLVPVKIKTANKLVASFVDLQAQTIHQMRINNDSLLKFFCETSDEKKRLPLMHYACMHSPAPSEIKENDDLNLSGTITPESTSLQVPIVSLMVDDIISLETTNMISEMIICLAYEKFREKCDTNKYNQNIVKLFPYNSPAYEVETAKRERPDYFFKDNLDICEDSSMDGDYHDDNNGDADVRPTPDVNKSGERSLLVAAKCIKIPQVAGHFGPICPELWVRTKALIEKGKHENFETTMSDNSESKWKKLSNGRISLKHMSSYVTGNNLPRSRNKYKPRASGLKFLNPQTNKVPSLGSKIYSCIRELPDLKNKKTTSKFYTESRENLEEMCELFCSCLTDEITQLLETFWDQTDMDHSQIYCSLSGTGGVTSSSSGAFGDSMYRVKLNKPAENKERLLLECFLKTQVAVENLAFEMPQGFSDFMFALGLRCYSLQYFSPMMKSGVFKLSEEMCRRIFEELDEKQQRASQEYDHMQPANQSLSASSLIVNNNNSREEIFTFKHEVLMKYDAMRPLTDSSTVINWEAGKRIAQDMILKKKLSDVKENFDKVPVPINLLSVSTSGSMSSGRGSIPSGMSGMSSPKTNRKPQRKNSENNASVDLVESARQNFQAYLDNKFGKNAPQLEKTPNHPSSKNLVAEDHWYYL